KPLEPKVARLKVEVAREVGEARVWLGDTEMPEHGLGLWMPILPGDIDVRAEAPGYLPVRTHVAVAPGQTRTVQLVFTPAPPPPDWKKPVRGVALGVGAVAATSTAVLWVLTNQQFHRVEALCGGQNSCPQGASAIARGRTYQTATQVSAGVAVAALGTWA